MVVNKITGERYQEEWLGSTLVLTSSSTGIKRVYRLPGRWEDLFDLRRGSFKKLKVRPELDIVSDLVRSLQLEINYLEKQGQKIFLKL